MKELAKTEILEEMKEMTQNQITALLDYVKVGEKLKIYCFSGMEWHGYEFEISGIVVSKEPDGKPLRQITKVNLEEGSFLEREKRTNEDFTIWKYNDAEQKLIVSAVRIEK